VIEIHIKAEQFGDLDAIDGAECKELVDAWRRVAVFELNDSAVGNKIFLVTLVGGDRSGSVPPPLGL